MSDTHNDDSDTFSLPPNEDWDHKDAASKITATFANQAFVQPLGDGLIRISFGETFPDELEVRYHTSVVMSARNALELAQIMYRFSAPIVAPTPIVETQVPSSAPPAAADDGN